jgi:malonyl-CoA decarboxylase
MRMDITRFRRTSVVNMLRAWRSVKGTARHAIKGKVHPDLPKEDMEYLKKRMIECVDGKGGDVSARAHSAELGIIYLQLNISGKERFLKTMAREFALENEPLIELLEVFKNAKNEHERLAAEHALRIAMNSPRLKILRQFNTLPDGFKFLVDMRKDLLDLTNDNIYLHGLEKDLKFVLTSLFDIGLLDMVEINWSSPAALLEKLIQYEAVHKISSWNDLKNRLDSDRRCFAFLHNKMPDEPLIFIEVALVKGMADNVQNLLNEESPVEDPEDADTAIFYSINNTQKGLAGISFGNFLIKWVVAELSSSYKNIKVFATLSPVPGFRKWLDPLLKAGDMSALKIGDLKTIQKVKPGDNAAGTLLHLLNTDWHRDEKTCEALKKPLIGLLAHYLVHKKRDIRALDPVAHFHLTNGASLERINWLADTSAKGLRQSAGIMVNYLYKQSQIDNNHEAYVTKGKINYSKHVKEWL